MDQTLTVQSENRAKPLTERERAELTRLSRRWATGRATVREMDRHRSLLRRAAVRS
jgi:hypothetical protein